MKILKSTLFALFSCFLFIGISTAQNNSDNEPIPDLISFCSQQKGFNLLGKFDVSWSNKGFTEKEFQTINELGFNFVRLPLDYRTFTQPGNWDSFVETEMQEIDRAVELGIQNNVHVCINFHRAPGFCINATTLPANQQLNLWTDIEAQNAFVKHWAVFAERYKSIPPKNLSFNLVNEPNNVAEEVYVRVMKRAIDTIHAITPNRLIFADAINVGKELLLSLKGEPNVAQSIHSYEPFSLTHYKASWVSGSSEWPVPQWPLLWVSNYLYGTWKTEFKSPLIFLGDFAEGTEVIINVGQVSIESMLTVKAGTKTLLNKKFTCGAEAGSDFTKAVQTEWGYQNISNLDFSCVLTEPATKISFENTSGDWMTINSISLKKDESVYTYNLSNGSWGEKQSTYLVDVNGKLKTEDGEDLLPFENYRTVFDLATEHSIPIMVQEFGVHNQTPHKVAVDFLSDLSALFRENNVGWALWNFDGSFGIMNSDRSDCLYESYEGYQLDREMLDALTKSSTTQSEIIKKPNLLLLYPSPAKDNLYLKDSRLIGVFTVNVSDLSGRILRTFQINSIGNETLKLNVSGLKSGMYFLSLKNNNEVFVGKYMVEE